MAYRNHRRKGRRSKKGKGYGRVSVQRGGRRL